MKNTKESWTVRSFYHAPGFSAGIALVSLLLTAASSGQVAATSKPGASALAKYDRNHNGVLDADELAVMQADQAKAAAAVVTTAATEKRDEPTIMSPFEVTA